MSSDDPRARTSDQPSGSSTHGDGPNQMTAARAAQASPGGLTSKKVFLTALAVTVVAFLAAATFGVLWLTTAAGEESEVAETRDEVVQEATKGVKAFTEFDYRSLDDARNRQMAISTKEMQGQLEQIWQPKAREAIIKQKRSASTTVFDIAVDELNTREGKARVLAALEVKLAEGEQSGVQRLRIQAEMERVDGVWKIAGLDRIAEAPPGS